MLQELRSSGIPVTDYTPSRGQDKLSRVNAVADIFASGMVWYPKTHWAEEVIEQCASFPRGSHDDLVDSTTLALMRFRQGGFLALPKDVDEDDEFFNINRESLGTNMAEENTDTLDDVDLKIGVLNPEAVQIESEDGSVLIDFDPNQSTANTGLALI